MLDTRTADPEVGQLVRVRGEQWLVTEIDRSRQAGDELSTTSLPGRTLVRLANVSGDDLGESLAVVWDVEPGREVLPPTAIPAFDSHRLDDPETFGAFLDTVRWGTVADADTSTMQAPFRAGITDRIEGGVPAPRFAGSARPATGSGTVCRRTHRHPRACVSGAAA